MSIKKIFVYGTHKKVYPQDQANYVTGYNTLFANQGLDVISDQMYSTDIANGATNKLQVFEFANTIERHKDYYMNVDVHAKRNIIKVKPKQIYDKVGASNFPANATESFLVFSSVGLFTTNSPLPNIIRVASNNNKAKLKLISFPKTHSRIDFDASFTYDVDVNNRLVSISYDDTDVKIKTLDAPVFTTNQSEYVWNVEDFFADAAGSTGDSYLRNSLGNYMIVAEYAAPAAPITGEYISAEINFLDNTPFNGSGLVY